MVVGKIRRSLDNTSTLAVIMVAPVVVYLLAAMAYPFLWSLYLSLTSKTVGGVASFVGLQNYRHLLHDSIFWRSLWNTLLFAGASVVLKLVFGFTMALILNRDFRGRSLVRSLLFLPWALPTLVSVLTWRWMLADVGGVVNYFLAQLGIVDRPVAWLAVPTLGMVSVITVNVWRGTPFFGISILSGLQAIPQELYEAAKIDGASVYQQFRNVTLPAVRGVVALVTVVSTIWTLNDFEVIWLLTRGGPANTTQVFSTYSYTLALQNLHLGQGIAVSLVILPLLVVAVLMTIRYIQRSA